MLFLSSRTGTTDGSELFLLDSVSIELAELPESLRDASPVEDIFDDVIDGEVAVVWEVVVVVDDVAWLVDETSSLSELEAVESDD